MDTCAFLCHSSRHPIKQMDKFLLPTHAAISQRSRLLHNVFSRMVVLIDDNTPDEFLDELDSSVNAIILAKDESIRVAFDCEGVNLSRLGTVEVVSLAFDDKCWDLPGWTLGTRETFLFDMGNESRVNRNRRSDVLKNLLESENVVKVIHDCRMDCDALYHLHQIRVRNVHDTSCFHKVIGRCAGQVNLNQLLVYNGLEENNVRDRGVYNRNPSYWARRPLTQEMKDWAASDVDKLLAVATKQVDRLRDNSSLTAKGLRDSKQFATYAVDMKVKSGLRVRGNVGRFIGRGGENIRRLEQRSGTLIYRNGDSWMVYYPNEEALELVKGVMGNSYHVADYDYDEYQYY